MQKIINLTEAAFGLCVAIWCSLYYIGKLNYKDDKEKRRQERVKKYRALFIIVILLLIFSSLYLIILTVS